MKPFPLFPLYPLIFTITSSAQVPQKPDQAEPNALETLVVTGKAESLIGTAASASKGQTDNKELMERPYRATARRTNISSAASTSTTAPTSPFPWTASR